MWYQLFMCNRHSRVLQITKQSILCLTSIFSLVSFVILVAVWTNRNTPHVLCRNAQTKYISGNNNSAEHLEGISSVYCILNTDVNQDIVKRGTSTSRDVRISIFSLLAHKLWFITEMHMESISVYFFSTNILELASCQLTANHTSRGYLPNNVKIIMVSLHGYWTL